MHICTAHRTHSVTVIAVIMVVIDSYLALRKDTGVGQVFTDPSSKDQRALVDRLAIGLALKPFPMSTPWGTTWAPEIASDENEAVSWGGNGLMGPHALAMWGLGGQHRVVPLTVVLWG